jgi:hypothetical protein
VVPDSCPIHTAHTHGVAWRLALLARPGMEVVVCPTQTGTWLVRSCTYGLRATSRRTYSKFTVTLTHARRAWWLLPLIACLLHRTSGSDALKLSNGRQHQPSPAHSHRGPRPRHRGHAHLTTPRAPTPKKKKSPKTSPTAHSRLPAGLQDATPVQSVIRLYIWSI